MQTKEFAPHQLRVVQERNGLEENLKKLKDFFNGDIFKSLSEIESKALKEQAHYMEGYLSVLNSRIERF